MSRKHRGISEILSVIILIVAVVASMAIYTSLSKERMFANMLSVSDALKTSEDRSAELLAKVWFTRTSNNATAYIINYGFKNVTIANVINGTNAVALNKFDTYLLSDTALTKPLGKVIPVLPADTTTKLFINQTNIADRVTVVTQSGRSYELLVDNP
jgi:hypothetical protein